MCICIVTVYTCTLEALGAVRVPFMAPRPLAALAVTTSVLSLLPAASLRYCGMVSLRTGPHTAVPDSICKAVMSQAVAAVAVVTVK
jgi:hypothetical protein